jgi:hypothetical protein
LEYRDMEIMKSVRRLAAMGALGLVVLMAAMPAADARNVTASIGGRSVVLVIDPDQCELDRSNPSDKRVYDLVERGLEGQNQLLLAAADCQQIPQWRNGLRPTLDDFTQVQVKLTFRDVDLTGREAATSREICGILRKQGDAIVSGPEVQRTRERFNSLSDSVKLNEATFIGVVYEDDQACYASLVQKVRTDQGRDKIVLSVYAHVVVRGRLLYIYRYTEGDRFEQLERMTQLLRQSVAAHLAANR